ncbi:MAG: hypothetical protein ACK5Q5_23835 [Planctomycetaceae bacterium]
MLGRQPDLPDPAGLRLGQCPLLALPEWAARDGALLFELQSWCFGQDVARVTGNGLVRLGFERYPPPVTHNQSASVYERRLDSQWRLTLWSFGGLLGHSTRGGVYLERAFRARFVAAENPLDRAWTVDELRFPNRAPIGDVDSLARPIVLRFIRWLAQYEYELLEHCGADYRRDCVASWHRTGAPEEPLADVWTDFGNRLASEWTDAGDDATTELA